VRWCRSIGLFVYYFGFFNDILRYCVLPMKAQDSESVVSE
jgi:hypothetical protein